MQRVLVVGGAGYIGSHMVYDLLTHGYEPVVLDNFSKSSLRNIHKIEELTGKKVEVVEADLRQPLTVEIANVDAILDFAAFKVVSESLAEPNLYYENNVNGTVHLLNWARERNIGKFIFSSSCAVYGTVEKMPITEATPVCPDSPYGHSKLMSEQVLRDACQAYDICALVLRYFNVAGNLEHGEIGDEDVLPTTLIPSIISSHLGLNPKALEVFGDDYDTRDGTSVRDFIHVLDLVAGHRKALEYLNDHSGFNIFNLGTETGSTIMEVIRTFEIVTGEKLNFEIGERRPGDIPVSIADASAAQTQLGWKPSRNLEDIITSAWNWYKSQSSSKIAA